MPPLDSQVSLVSQCPWGSRHVACGMRLNYRDIAAALLSLSLSLYPSLYTYVYVCVLQFQLFVVIWVY